MNSDSTKPSIDHKPGEGILSRELLLTCTDAARVLRDRLGYDERTQ